MSINDSQQEKPEDIKIKLLKYIQETGYPTEMKVKNIFSLCGIDNVECNSYFIDEDEKKGREIDICAYTAVTSIKLNLIVALGLICEIKKLIKYPWVIFSTNREPIEIHGWLKLHYTNRKTDSRLLSNEDIDEKCTTTKFTRIGKSYVEGFKKSDVNSNIFEALITVSKAAEHWLKTNEGALKKTSNPSAKVITFVDPLIVVDGSLFEAWLNKNNQIILHKTKHLAISCRYISKNYTRFSYLVEVVTLSELPNLIEKKLEWINHIKEAMAKTYLQNK